MNSISNNAMAVNVADNLNGHYGRLKTSVQRLSSGRRINSAADDAAGLAIRELMRADVAALNQGVRNANDAISMLQTADAALAVIDEKLIRMKELAEQAATGTYDSTQRLMIHSEFQAMASEIDRIARATDFNGIKLLDGSLSGAHDGSGMNSTGKMKIHFGAANDSAEDYYYVEIGDCTLTGLGLREGGHAQDARPPVRFGQNLTYDRFYDITPTGSSLPGGQTSPPSMTDIVTDQWKWCYIPQDFIMYIPKGTENIVLYAVSSRVIGAENDESWAMDNDLQLFTRSGVHLAGTKYTPGDPVNSDPVWYHDWGLNNTIEYNKNVYGFGDADYDGRYLNSGPGYWTIDIDDLQLSQYNGMNIYYGGDYEAYDNIPNNMRPSGQLNSWQDYELLMIDRATEDLIVTFPGDQGGYIKVAWGDSVSSGGGGNPQPPPIQPEQNLSGEIISIASQEGAQQALVAIDRAIVSKDQIRAHLGALQNRLENTVANLTIQSENLQAAESRISDVDVAREMTEFVRNQVLAQSAVAMLGQANSYPHILAGLING